MPAVPFGIPFDPCIQFYRELKRTTHGKKSRRPGLLEGIHGNIGDIARQPARECHKIRRGRREEDIFPIVAHADESGIRIGDSAAGIQANRYCLLFTASRCAVAIIVDINFHQATEWLLKCRESTAIANCEWAAWLGSGCKLERSGRATGGQTETSPL